MTEIKVMIVEDEEATLTLHKSVVNNEQDMVVIATASTKMSAIELAVQYKPDVVLMDINLTQKEDQQGIDAAIQLSIVSPDTKIIMLSGLLNEDTVRSTLGIGIACNYLLKNNPQLIPGVVRSSYNQINNIEGTVVDLIVKDYRSTLRSTMNKLTPQHLKILELFYRGYNAEDVSTILQIEKQSVLNHQQTISKKCLGWKYMFRKLNTIELAQRAKVLGMF